MTMFAMIIFLYCILCTMLIIKIKKAEQPFTLTLLELCNSRYSVSHDLLVTRDRREFTIGAYDVSKKCAKIDVFGNEGCG